jgi:hypothetical protein
MVRSTSLSARAVCRSVACLSVSPAGKLTNYHALKDLTSDIGEKRERHHGTQITGFCRILIMRHVLDMMRPVLLLATVLRHIVAHLDKLLPIYRFESENTHTSISWDS